VDETPREAQGRLRVALAAHEERARLVEMRDALGPELADAEAEVGKLVLALAAERTDVRRYEAGAWSVVYGIVADREARLRDERQEAEQAELRHAEASTMRDRLRDELASLAARIEALGDTHAELEAARAARHAELVAQGGEVGEELHALAAELDAAGAQLRTFDESLIAGQRAHASLTQLIDVLSSARNWGVADILTDSLPVSFAKRNRLDAARELVGSVQLDLAAFHRELELVSIALEAEVEGLADYLRFADVWFDAFSDYAVQERIADALHTTRTVQAEVTGLVARLQWQRASATERCEALTQRRLALIDRR